MSDVQRQTWTAEEYFADSRTSRSDLELFRKSASMYFGVKAGTLTLKETAALRRGQLLHLAVLEPAEYERRVVIAPETDDDFRGTGAKARREAWKAELARWRAGLPTDAIVMAPDDPELGRIAGMVAALRSKKTAAAKAARGLLFGAGGESELAVTWRDEDPELAQPMGCRARLDRLIVRTSALVVDLKTSEDPSADAFSTAIARYGYHRQAAWYCHAGHALVGTSLPRFAFVVVRSEPPHEVAVYELEAEAIAAGDHENRQTLRALSRALVEKNCAAPWECAVQKINLPAWARKREVSQ